MILRFPIFNFTLNPNSLFAIGKSCLEMWRVNFYIDNGTGEYELDETLTIPRNKLRVGMALFEGLDRKGGWTRWGNVYVEAIEADGVVTTKGLASTASSVVVAVKNVMPYRDGYYSIRLR